jgi:ornithine cyclodeaminase
MTAPLWLSEADVTALMHLGEAIDALEATLRLEASGQARNMEKTHASWGHGHTMHAIGAVVEGEHLVGTKSWAHAEGATPILLLWHSETGALVAVIEAFALGQMRTGAISGLASRWMADQNARVMAILGTGKQALTQVAAVVAVRPIETLRVFSPTAANREAFAAKTAKSFPRLKVEAVSSVEAATSDAAIVTLVTRARAPIVSARHLARGAHVNAVGAIVPERCEFAGDVFARTQAIAVDTLPSVKALSREFREEFADRRQGDWSAVEPLSARIARGARRDVSCDISLFKAMGMGLSDLALGAELIRRARARGLGRALPPVVRAAPRLSG